jgi:aspartate/methionine/tyrosine aminotransferase
VVLKEVNELCNKGRDIINFCIGQPDFDTPQYIKQAAIEAINDGKTGYSESSGIWKLREAVAEYFSRSRNIDVNPTSIVIANGAKPFIGYSILSVTDYGAGHEVLYPNPGFPIYESQIRAHGAIPVPLNLQEARGYAFDMKELKQKVNDRSRLLILNSPHNPTGGALKASDLAQIAEIVQRYENLWVLSDEIYSQLLYNDTFTSIAEIPEMKERTIILDGVSKTYAMTGWRIGFASNEKLAKYFSRWIINTDSCACHPSQYAALAALTGPQNDVEQMKRSYKRRRDVIVNGLDAIDGITCQSPPGAFYAWPNITDACQQLRVNDSEAFRQKILYNAGIAVLSDVHFGTKIDGEGEHLRFSYATSEDNIHEGLYRLRDCIDSAN